MTWAGFDKAGWRLAAFLQTLGVARGARVNLHMHNQPEFLAAWLACARLGAIIVPTNPLLSADELGYVLDHSEATLSVAGPPLVDGVRKVIAAGRRAITVIAADDSSVVGSIWGSGHAQPADLPPGGGEDVAILYTSGTTARPKGVLVTNANYVFAGETVAQHIGLRSSDRFLTVLPLFHGNAQYYSVMAVLVTGSTLVLADRFSASRYFLVGRKHKATVASLFAAPIRMLLAQPESAGERQTKIRVVLFAQNLTDQQLREWERRTGVPLLQLYGMTETMGPPLMNPLWGERRNHSVGRVVLGYRCRIVVGGQREAGIDEAGELLIGGEPGVSITRGYFRNEDASKELLEGGWLHTGDIVRRDADGFVHFVDRAKDMIKRAGENVAASEVEEVLRRHPAIFDVAVVGVPDELRDESIVAFVVPQSGMSANPEELIEWCRERLAKFRIPERIEVVQSLPRTSVGKIQKHLLRASYLSRA